MKTFCPVEEFHIFFLVYLFLMGRLGLSWLVFNDVWAFSKNLDTCSNTALYIWLLASTCKQISNVICRKNACDYGVKKKKKYVWIQHAPASVATEECLLGILPMSTRCKAPGHWHLCASVSRVWNVSRRRASKYKKPNGNLYY